MKHIKLYEEFVNESEAGRPITEDEINATIALMDKTANAAGFKLYKKSTGPKKAFATLAIWLPIDVTYQKGDRWTPFVTLVWSKPTGVYVTVADPYTGGSPILGTPQTWTNPQKWATVIKVKNSLSDTRYDLSWEEKRQKSQAFVELFGKSSQESKINEGNSNIKNGSTFIHKEGKSSMNAKKGFIDAEEGDTLTITAIYDNGEEFKAQLNTKKWGAETVLVSKSQLTTRSWDRTK